MSIDEVIDAVSGSRSSWTRADVVQVICDRQRPVSRFGGRDWARAVETAADRVVDRLVDLDPDTAAERRVSDGRSVWIEPTAARYTSTDVLTQEEAVIVWALLAQTDDPTPSTTLDTTGLDDGQADAAAAVAGDDRLVLVVGPAGAGKTRTLAAAVTDLQRQGRRCWVSPRQRKRPGCWAGTPGWRPTPSPSSSTTGTTTPRSPACSTCPPAAP